MGHPAISSIDRASPGRDEFAQAGMDWTPSFVLLAIFAASRLAYFAAGVRFDVRPLGWFFQIADPLLLRTRLAETLFYLHMQPPGFNLLIGVALKLFPVHYAAALHGVYLLCGASLCFTLYPLMRVLGAGPRAAMAVTGVFLVSPGVVLFENFLIYEYPLMAILCASAMLFYRLLMRPAPLRALAFFFALAILVYVRALFHLGWFVAIAGATVWLLKGHRKMAITAAALPFLLCLGLFLKNLMVFGTFVSSTWMAFNAETVTTNYLTRQEHRQLVDAGVLSRVGLTSQYNAIDAFAPLVKLPAATGIAVLDQVRDSSGLINFNNLGYLAVHPYFMADAKEIVLHYPHVYFRSVVDAWLAYFVPSGDFWFFSQNRPRILFFDRWFNRIVFGQWRDFATRRIGPKIMLLPVIGIYLMIGLPLLFVMGLEQLWRQVRSSGWTPTASLLAFLLFNIGFITALVNFLSTAENNRYRLPLDPFYAALLAVAFTRLAGRTKRLSPAASRSLPGASERA